MALATALKYQESKGTWPKIRDADDANEFAGMAKILNEERKSMEDACWLQKFEWGFPSGEPVDKPEEIEAKLKRFSFCLQSELTGFCAFLGGVAAQEVIKKTGKFTPIEQWIHHDDPLLFEEAGSAGIFGGTRYGTQAAIFGTDFMEKMRRHRL